MTVSKAVGRQLLLLIPMVLACVLISGVLLPVYSDEVVTKFNTARFFLENGRMVSLYPQCSTTVGHGVAWVFFPAAILISSIYGHLEPLGIRISGVVLALTWFALLAYWSYKQAEDAWVIRFTLLAAFGSLGVVPYLWVLSRPEQFMLLPVLITCVMALHVSSGISRSTQWIIAGILGLLLSVFFYAHPKSLFFTPFFFGAVWIATRGFQVPIRAGLLLYTLALSVQVLRDASALGDCHDAPSIQALLAANTLLPSALVPDPVAFFRAVWQNISLFSERMLVHVVFNATFQSGWLPPLSENPPLLAWLNPLIHFTLLILVVGSHLLAVGLALGSLLVRRMSAPLLLALLLSVGNLINIALYNLQNFYAGIQYVPLSIVIVSLLYQRLQPVRLSMPARAAGFAILSFAVSLSLTSLLTLFYLVTPNLFRNANFEGASLLGQPLSIPALEARAHLDSIRKLGETCDIPVDSAMHVVVDHMTYFAYLKDREPIHVLYVSEFGYGGDLINGKLLPFLKEVNSPGLITRCEWVPHELRDVQRQNERGYCCVDLKGL